MPEPLKSRFGCRAQAHAEQAQRGLKLHIFRTYRVEVAIRARFGAENGSRVTSFATNTPPASERLPRNVSELSTSPDSDGKDEGAGDGADEGRRSILSNVDERDLAHNAKQHSAYREEEKK